MAAYQLTVHESFDETYRRAMSAVAALGLSSELRDVVSAKAGDKRIKMFIAEKFFWRNGGVTSLSVTLVENDGLTEVLAAGSGGGTGVVNLSFGSNKSIVKSFIKRMEM